MMLRDSGITRDCHLTLEVPEAKPASASAQHDASSSGKGLPKEVPRGRDTIKALSDANQMALRQKLGMDTNFNPHSLAHEDKAFCAEEVNERMRHAMAPSKSPEESASAARAVQSRILDPMAS